MRRREQCAYAKLGMQKDTCEEIRCDGFPEEVHGCFQYTTINHLSKFRGMFRLRNPEHSQIQKFKSKWGNYRSKLVEKL